MSSPLDQLHLPVDKVWEKVSPGYVLTDEDITTLVEHDRAAREAFIKKSTAKKLKREIKEQQLEEAGE